MINVLGVCWDKCEDGYINSGATCTARTYSVDSHTAKLDGPRNSSYYIGTYDSCDEGYNWTPGLCTWFGGASCNEHDYPNLSGLLCYKNCETDYEMYTDGICQREGPWSYDKRSITPDTYGNGAGTELHCGEDYDTVASSCYTKCPEGKKHMALPTLCSNDGITIDLDSFYIPAIRVKQRIVPYSVK